MTKTKSKPSASMKHADDDGSEGPLGGEGVLQNPSVRQASTIPMRARLQLFYGLLFLIAVGMVAFGCIQMAILLSGEVAVLTRAGAALLAVSGVALFVEFYSASRIDFR